MSWLGGLFGKKNDLSRDTLSSESFHSTMGGEEAPVGLSVPGGSVQNARQLIMQCANQIVHTHGIPKDWLRFEILTMADDAKAYFQLQVTMKYWDAYLLLHSHAFEMALMNRIRESNLQISRAVRAVLWRVANDAGCPYEQLPPTIAWTQDAIAQRMNNPQMFKANKPNYLAPSNWRPEDHAATVFQETHHIDAEDAEAELQRSRNAQR